MAKSRSNAGEQARLRQLAKERTANPKSRAGREALGNRALTDHNYEKNVAQPERRRKAQERREARRNPPTTKSGKSLPSKKKKTASQTMKKTTPSTKGQTQAKTTAASIKRGAKGTSNIPNPSQPKPNRVGPVFRENAKVSTQKVGRAANATNPWKEGAKQATGKGVVKGLGKVAGAVGVAAAAVNEVKSTVDFKRDTRRPTVQEHARGRRYGGGTAEGVNSVKLDAHVNNFDVTKNPGVKAQPKTTSAPKQSSSSGGGKKQSTSRGSFDREAYRAKQQARKESVYRINTGKSYKDTGQRYWSRSASPKPAGSDKVGGNPAKQHTWSDGPATNKSLQSNVGKTKEDFLAEHKKKLANTPGARERAIQKRAGEYKAARQARNKKKWTDFYNRANNPGGTSAPEGKTDEQVREKPMYSGWNG